MGSPDHLLRRRHRFAARLNEECKRIVVSPSKVLLIASLLSISGYSKSPLELVQVSGTVKSADGTVPVAQYRLIRFEPVADATGRLSSRAASAKLRPDGTFQAMTLRPGDGMMAGDYKVVLLFWKSYVKRDSVLPAVYGSAKTTPLPTIRVKQDETNHFDLVLDLTENRKL